MQLLNETSHSDHFKSLVQGFSKASLTRETFLYNAFLLFLFSSTAALKHVYAMLVQVNEQAGH